MKINVVTLFSGYDSQCLALDMLKEKFSDFDYDLVGWSEIDRYAIQAHNAIYPQYAQRNLGDITKVDWNEFKTRIDLLTYSFPCQDISSAGKQRGLSKGGGTRSGLLWECERCISACLPACLLMENVKALLQEKFLTDFTAWQELLESYGYKNHWQIMNARDYGVPQNRERVFMVSFLDPNVSRTFSFPKPFTLTKTLGDVLDDDVDSHYYLSNERINGLLESSLKELRKKNGFMFNAKKKSEIANTLTTSCGGGRKTDNFIVE